MVETVSLVERQTIHLPTIGDYKDVPVVEILVQPGNTVNIADTIIVLESDKATIEVPSPVSGTVVELMVEIGSKVSEGSPIAIFETSEKASAMPKAEAVVSVTPPDAAASATSPMLLPSAAPAPVVQAPGAEASTPSIPAAASKAHASPSVRAYARELGVSLDEVKPTGRKGRIMREDVQVYVKDRIAVPQAQGGIAVAPAPTYDFSRYGEIERVPLTRIQQISGSSLHRNWVTIPHVTNFDEADITDIEAFRVAMNAEAKGAKAKLTMVAFLAKASALALKEHPRFNSSLEGDTLMLKKYIHVGVAVDTPKGLLVPVVRDCDRKGLNEIAEEIAALAEKARNGKLAPSDMEGGSFSVSSLGGIGGTGFTPIINAPEVAILGAARAEMQPRWDGTTFQPRLILPVSLSWDHRVVDGVAAARFLGTLVKILGDFRRAAL